MIAIKDVKLPVDCQSCFARFGSWCRLDLDERMVVPALPGESVNGFKPEWCPLFEVQDEAGNCSEFPNNSESVSRRAVIDALEGEITVTGIKNAVAVKEYVDLALDRIKRLPSVQPETDLQSTCNQLATERYEDLCEYFGNQRDPILTDRREFKKWLDRVKWHVKKVDELVRRSEDEWCTDCPAYDHEKHCCPRFNHVIRETVEEMRQEKPERKKGKCVWCDSPFRIEYYWIDREGCTASFQDEERHLVATGIANFCPNCGSDMRGEQDEQQIERQDRRTGACEDPS